MKKIVVAKVMILALLLGGCGNAAAGTVAGAEKTDTGGTEPAAAAGSSASNGEAPDAAPEEDGGAGVSDEGGKGEAAAGETEVENKEKTAENGEVVDNGAEGDDEGKKETEDGSAEESRKPQLADYEITVFSETEIMYASDPVNVRKGPTVDFDRVGGLRRGQEVTVTGQADTGWYEIAYGKDKAYVSGRYLQKEKPEEETENSAAENPEAAQAQNTADSQEAQTPEAAAAQAAEAQAQAEAPAPAAETPAPAQTAVQEVKNVAGVIMVGDSRFVQMQQNIGENSCTWIAEGGKGYNWFSETAIAKIDGCVGKGSKVLINLGVNDPGHVNDYLALVNAKAAEWVGKGASVYYASVNPVWDNPYTTEEQVEYFNSQMQAGLSGDVHWIDSHSYLTSIGYKLVDGLHYSAETYQNIYAYFMSCL